MAEIVKVSNMAGITAEALRRVRAALDNGQQEARLFSLALSGGSTPGPFHEGLAVESNIDWSRFVVLWGDERAVPPNHADSNYRAAHQQLLSKVAPMAVWRMAGEASDLSKAAKNYEACIRSLPGAKISMAILGMGDDGHTASLFPGEAAVTDRLVAETPEPYPGKHRRLTLTDAGLDACEEVLILVSGENKADRLAEVLAGGDLPLARILANRRNKPTTVIVDGPAAKSL
ncbi:MAG: 6-phosphogluconolactonase [Myxococcales bacterium]|nr:6-phosphogluconolactonase [Myxococcales bacterium]